MHAVLVKVSINDIDGSYKELRETVVPRVWAARVRWRLLDSI